jgi:type II secretory pathway component PulF
MYRLMPNTGEAIAFSYQAQTVNGNTISGTVDSPTAAAAAAQLQALQLRITRLDPITKPPRATPLGAEDFLAFNQQLAHLTAGGLPVERGLRLIAGEMTHAGQKAAVLGVAKELEKGKPLGAAFAAHRNQFPPLYGRLIDAGVKANDLPAVLLNLGRHLTLVGRLRASLWRTATYPLSVATALLAVMAFIWLRVMPELEPLAEEFHNHVPGQVSTMDIFIPLARDFSYSMMAVLAISLATVLICALVTKSTSGRAAVEPLLLRVPLIGPILRLNLLARWCDALHLAITAGLDLPAAIALSSDAVDSPRLNHDGKLLIDSLSAGRTLDDVAQTQMLPPVIPAGLQMGCEQSDLPNATAMLSRMYQEQAEVRLAVLPAILSPLLLFLTAICVGVAVFSALLPLVVAIQYLAHPF